MGSLDGICSRPGVPWKLVRTGEAGWLLEPLVTHISTLCLHPPPTTLSSTEGRSWCLIYQ